MPPAAGRRAAARAGRAPGRSRGRPRVNPRRSRNRAPAWTPSIERLRVVVTPSAGQVRGAGRPQRPADALPAGGLEHAHRQPARADRTASRGRHDREADVVGEQLHASLGPGAVLHVQGRARQRDRGEDLVADREPAVDVGVVLGRPDQWWKCRRPVKTIDGRARSTAAITSSSRLAPPGWMNDRTPASSASSGPSSNGKNASDASDAPVDRLLRLRERDADGVDAAHLAGADADGGEVAREHDRVRRDVLRDAPREDAGRPTRARSASRVGDDGHHVAVLGLRVVGPAPACRRAPAAGRARRGSTGAARGSRGCAGSACAPAPRPRRRRSAGANTHLDEVLGQRLGQRHADRAVEDDHAAERRLRDRSAKAFAKASSMRAPMATPHGLVCLMITHAGSVELAQRCRAPRRDVGDVVERQPLAAVLVHHRQHVPAGAALRVVRGALVRVLAVAAARRAAISTNRRLRERRRRLGEPVGDRRVVARGVREGLGRQPRRVRAATASPVVARARRARRRSRSGSHHDGHVARSSSRPRAASPARRCRCSRSARLVDARRAAHGRWNG